MMLRFAALVVLVLLPEATALAQRDFGRRGRRFMGGDPNEFYVPPDWEKNVPYDGRFTFVRIKYRGYEKFNGREGPGWSHDYPRAESHLMRIMREVTTMRPFIEFERASVQQGALRAGRPVPTRAESQRTDDETVNAG